jgi:hypothetical protein
MIRFLENSVARIVNLGGFCIIFAFCIALDTLRLGIDWIDWIDWFFSVAL